MANPASAFVADFVGADRGLKALAVTPIDPSALEHPSTLGPQATLADARAALAAAGEAYAVVVDACGHPTGWLEVDTLPGEASVAEVSRPLGPTVSLPASLQEALSALLLAEVPRVVVLDDGRLCGVMTPVGLHPATNNHAGVTTPFAASATMSNTSDGSGRETEVRLPKLTD